ncbi:MAG: hypothetical protein KDJ97_12115 [Anaerolineae bacterium]|nr:hypothetical protein [Anaerolineae bacterium]
MNRQLRDEQLNQTLSAQLERAAPDFPYPPLPDIEQRVNRQLTREAPSRWRWRYSWGWGWAAIAVGIILLGLLAVPPVRAALVDMLQLGAVRIFLIEPTPTATSVPPTSSSLPPTPIATPVSSVLDLAGETTLAEARERVDFTIRLPAYPANLGQPDRVFVQDFAGPVIILTWLDPDQPERVRLSLHMLGPNTYAQKMQPALIERTEVRGQPALWTQGPYLLQFQDGSTTTTNPGRLVDGHVLIWLENEITYRLETDLPLAEAVRIAESLR